MKSVITEYMLNESIGHACLRGEHALISYEISIATHVCVEFAAIEAFQPKQSLIRGFNKAAIWST